MRFGMLLEVLPVLLGAVFGYWVGWLRVDPVPALEIENGNPEVAFTILPEVKRSQSFPPNKSSSSPLLRRCATLDQLLRAGKVEEAFRYLHARSVIGWENNRREIDALMGWLCLR